MKEIARGGYVLKDGGGKPDIILIATGSEMEITLLAAEKLTGEGRNVRVVSLPSTDIFDAGTRHTASRFCRRTSAHASRSKRVLPITGTNMWG